MFYMHVPSFFHFPFVLFLILVMHDWVWGIESDARGGGAKQYSTFRWLVLFSRE
jgi:hypothetical protein